VTTLRRRSDFVVEVFAVVFCTNDKPHTEVKAPDAVNATKVFGTVKAVCSNCLYFCHFIQLK